MRNELLQLRSIGKVDSFCAIRTMLVTFTLLLLQQSLIKLQQPMPFRMDVVVVVVVVVTVVEEDRFRFGAA